MKHKIAGLFVLIGAVCLLPGCATSGANPKSKLIELQLLTLPVALDLDGRPGPDGVPLKIFAFRRIDRKSEPILQGRLEIEVEELDSGAGPKPLHSASFSPEQLRPRQIKTAVGIAYDLFVRWDPKRPQSDRLLVRARHVSESGAIVESQPSAITVATDPPRPRN